MSSFLAFFLAGALAVVFVGGALFAAGVLAYYILPILIVMLALSAPFAVKNFKKQRDQRLKEKSFVDGLRYDDIKI